MLSKIHAPRNRKRVDCEEGRKEERVKEAGNKDYTIIELPKLNHAFQTCVIGSWAEYEQNEETIAPSALNIMTDWILERTVC